MPNDAKTFFVVVPVFNEAPNLPDLMDSFHHLASQMRDRQLTIILIDDGSTDGTTIATKQLSADLTLTVLAHRHNRGPGAAFGTAFDYLADRLNTDDWIATIEGDNTR